MNATKRLALKDDSRWKSIIDFTEIDPKGISARALLKKMEAKIIGAARRNKETHKSL